LFKDSQGRDAEMTVQGTQVTFKVTIYIWGSGATSQMALEMQSSILHVFNRGPFGPKWQYTDPATGTNYGVKFDVSVKLLSTVTPKKHFTPAETVEHFSDDNVIEVRNTKGRSHVSGGKTGIFAAGEPDFLSYTVLHEFPHLIGLDDRYTENKDGSVTIQRGYERNVMATRRGVLQQRNIDDLMTPMMKRYKSERKKLPSGDYADYSTKIKERNPSW
jgi:hypothetical protein